MRRRSEKEREREREKKGLFLIVVGEGFALVPICEWARSNSLLHFSPVVRWRFFCRSRRRRG